MQPPKSRYWVREGQLAGSGAGGVGAGTCTPDRNEHGNEGQTIGVKGQVLLSIGQYEWAAQKWANSRIVAHSIDNVDLSCTFFLGNKVLALIFQTNLQDTASSKAACESGKLTPQGRWELQWVLKWAPRWVLLWVRRWALQSVPQWALR